MEFKVGDIQDCHIWPEGDAYKIHIVAVIDEPETFCPQIVYRYYGKMKARWFYAVDNARSVENNINIAKKDREKHGS